jgi:hypothetical protein
VGQTQTPLTTIRDDATPWVPLQVRQVPADPQVLQPVEHFEHYATPVADPSKYPTGH